MLTYNEFSGYLLNYELISYIYNVYYYFYIWIL